MINLSPTFAKELPQEFFANKLELFLTCRAVAAFLRENILNEAVGNFLEEAALNAIYRTLFSPNIVSDLKLFLSELPNILKLKYPVVENLRLSAINLSSQMLVIQPDWKSIMNLQYMTEILQTFNNYMHK